MYSKGLTPSFSYLYRTYFGDLQIEKDEIENLPDLLKGCGLFIDVGASLGMYTYFANQILSNRTIIAIEADPDRYEELKKNCKKWESEKNNTIRAIHAVVGDSNEGVTFFKTGTHISGGLFTVPERSDNYDPVEVPQVMLDDFYDPSLNTVVKIDVEGAEHRVLLGAKRIMGNKNSKFSIGIHSWGDLERGKKPTDLIKLAYSKGLHISKTCTRMTSNYIFQYIECNRADLRNAYLKLVPLIFARQLYRAILPVYFARFIDRKLNAIRVKKISKKL